VEEWRNQIGYSVRLSFPSRKDKSVVQHFLAENPGILDSPLQFLDRFRRVADVRNRPRILVRRTGTSRAAMSPHRALSDHRFWRLVQAISLGRKTSSPFELLMEMVRG